jgi:CDP-4-dehydro-6-deoxyglucose reductase
MSYKVQIQSSGEEFTVEDNETVLDAALRQGITIPYGCRSGACGACKGTLVTGQINYSLGKPPGIIQEEIDSGKALMCQAIPESDLVVDVIVIETAKEIEIKNLPCRVTKQEKLCHDVIRLYLKLPESERLQFLAGQYIDILLKDGRRRSFSIANAPHDDEYIELHIRHIPDGDFTTHIFNEMQEKELLRFEGPLGTFTLQEDSNRPIIFMAGGTGFAPIKGIIEHAFSEGVKRPMHLYWGARAKRDLYLEDLPKQWAQQYNNFTFTPVLSEPMSEDNWQGKTGFVHEAIIEDYPELSTYEIYAGGPPLMVEAGVNAFTKHGLEKTCYFTDAFEFAKD